MPGSASLHQLPPWVLLPLFTSYFLSEAALCGFHFLLACGLHACLFADLFHVASVGFAHVATANIRYAVHLGCFDAAGVRAMRWVAVDHGLLCRYLFATGLAESALAFAKCGLHIQLGFPRLVPSDWPLADFLLMHVFVLKKRKPEDF